MKLKYTGEAPSGIRIGTKEILPGDVIDCLDETTANYFKSFRGFEAVADDEPKKKKAKEG